MFEASFICLKYFCNKRTQVPARRWVRLRGGHLDSVCRSKPARRLSSRIWARKGARRCRIWMLFRFLLPPRLLAERSFEVPCGSTASSQDLENRPRGQTRARITEHHPTPSLERPPWGPNAAGRTSGWPPPSAFHRDPHEPPLLDTRSTPDRRHLPP